MMKDLRLSAKIITVLFVASSLGTKLISASSFDVRPPTDITIIGLLRGLTSFLPVVLVFIFMLMLVYGGFTRMTAAGDPDKIQRSMQILIAAVIGFVIVALAPVIVNILGLILGIDDSLVST